MWTTKINGVVGRDADTPSLVKIRLEIDLTMTTTDAITLDRMIDHYQKTDQLNYKDLARALGILISNEEERKSFLQALSKATDKALLEQEGDRP